MSLPIPDSLVLEEWSDPAGYGSVKLFSDRLEIRYDRFMTHTHLGRKFVKISGQSIYSGAVARYARANMIEQIKVYLYPMILAAKRINNFGTNYWSDLEFVFGVPQNYASVRRLANGQYSTTKADVKSRFDYDNQWVWTKTFKDALVDKGMVPDDDVLHMPKGSICWEETGCFEGRFLKFILYP